jgi:alkanesulfonate monooxygenase SsuD/methylene tetrahydromethanopterin reductase-like flavin-dependent oxidoreductase (luciferase family)
MATYDALAFGAAVGTECKQLAITVGPLAVGVRTSLTLAMGTASVAALSGRPAGLAIGTSSTVVVERWHGRSRGHANATLSETARVVLPLLRGEKSDGEGFHASSHGYRLRLNPPGAHLRISALGTRAIEVAASYGDRMVANLVTPETVRRLRAALVGAAESLGRPCPTLESGGVCDRSLSGVI